MITHRARLYAAAKRAAVRGDIKRAVELMLMATGRRRDGSSPTVFIVR